MTTRFLICLYSIGLCVCGQVLEATLPFRTDRQVAGYFEDKIYLIGGNNATNGSNQNTETNYHWEFDVLTERIVQKDNLRPSFFNGAQSYTYSENIIYFASTARIAINKIYKYDMKLNKLIIDNAPILHKQIQYQETRGTGCVTYNVNTNAIYIIGGYDGSNTSNIVQCFNDKLNIKWSILPNMKQARMDHTCQYWNGNNKLYVFGGGHRYQNKNYYIDSIESYNLSIRTEWDINLNRFRNGMANLRSVIHEKLNKIIVIGGFNGLSVNTTYIFDPNQNILNPGPDLKVRRCNHAAVYDPISSNIYIFGGWFQDPSSHRWDNSIEKLIIPTLSPTNTPTNSPTNIPTNTPTSMPTNSPVNNPTNLTSFMPTVSPTQLSPLNPTSIPTNNPTKSLTKEPELALTSNPTMAPTISDDVVLQSRMSLPKRLIWAISITAVLLVTIIILLCILICIKKGRHTSKTVREQNLDTVITASTTTTCSIDVNSDNEPDIIANTETPRGVDYEIANKKHEYQQSMMQKLSYFLDKDANSSNVSLPNINEGLQHETKPNNNTNTRNGFTFDTTATNRGNYGDNDIELALPDGKSTAFGE